MIMAENRALVTQIWNRVGLMNFETGCAYPVPATHHYSK